MSTMPPPPDEEAAANDPRGSAPDMAETHDPHSGMSDDPRVDATPDRRQSE